MELGQFYVRKTPLKPIQRVHIWQIYGLERSQLPNLVNGLERSPLNE